MMPCVSRKYLILLHWEPDYNIKMSKTTQQSPNNPRWRLSQCGNISPEVVFQTDKTCEPSHVLRKFARSRPMRKHLESESIWSLSTWTVFQVMLAKSRVFDTQPIHRTYPVVLPQRPYNAEFSFWMVHGLDLRKFPFLVGSRGKLIKQ